MHVTAYIADSQLLRETVPPSAADDNLRLTRGYGHPLAGEQCTGAGQGGPEANTEEKDYFGNLPNTKMDEQEIKKVSGFWAPDLDAFMWLIEFVAESKLTCEIWFNKLIYYYIDGVLSNRRVLRTNDKPNFE